MRVSLLIGLGLMIAMAPATAQVRSSSGTSAATDGQDDDQPLVQQQQQTPFDTNPTGRTAQSSAGQVGQRQSREAAAVQAGIKPTARISSRIQNRVQNRIGNRIDRNYDPQAGATDPFAIAEEQTRSTGRPR